MGNYGFETGTWVWRLWVCSWLLGLLWYRTECDHLRAMGLELIVSVKVIGCAVTLDALEPLIFRIFRCNVGAAM